MTSLDLKRYPIQPAIEGYQRRISNAFSQTDKYGSTMKRSIWAGMHTKIKPKRFFPAFQGHKSSQNEENFYGSRALLQRLLDASANALRSRNSLIDDNGNQAGRCNHNRDRKKKVDIPFTTWWYYHQPK